MQNQCYAVVGLGLMTLLPTCQRMVPTKVAELSRTTSQQPARSDVMSQNVARVTGSRWLETALEVVAEDAADGTLEHAALRREAFVGGAHVVPYLGQIALW